jgi:uroporphyrinogen decarboxylase
METGWWLPKRREDAAMTGRERVLAAMRHRVPDRTPFDFGHGFSPAKLTEFRERTGQDDPIAYFGADSRTVGIGPTRGKQDFSAYHRDLPARATIDEWGVGHLPTESADSAHSHLDGFLYPMTRLTTAADARDYPLPDLEADYRYMPVRDAICRWHAEGLAVTASMECTVFEVAWYLRSMEMLLMDFVDNPEFAAALLDRIIEKRVIQAKRFVELGADVIRLGDDVASQRGMLMSVPMWRRWLKPRLARVIDAARRVRPDILIFYHTDGNATAIVPELMEIGVDILNPVQPECMDPAGLKRAFGHRMCFWGTVGTQSTMPFGTADDVRSEVRHRIATVGAGGGLVLAPTHMIEPDVPWENLLAFVETVKEG